MAAASEAPCVSAYTDLARKRRRATMLQFLTSWPVLLWVAMALMALALLIDPAIPSRPDSQFTEVAELTF
jgi:hypothetical protein